MSELKSKEYYDIIALVESYSSEIKKIDEWADRLKQELRDIIVARIKKQHYVSIKSDENIFEERHRTSLENIKSLCSYQIPEDAELLPTSDKLDKQDKSVNKHSVDILESVVNHFKGESGITNVLQEERKKKKITQKELATRMGVSTSEMSRLEKGPDMKVKTIIKICKAMGVSAVLKIGDSQTILC